VCSSDLRHLVRFFVEKLSKEMGRHAEFSEAALELLERWRWPGNVRELDNEVRRAIALTSGVIGPQDLSPAIQKGT
jgi:DNA-binding NtrC family response regulator